MLSRPIYMDSHATTPVDPRVLEVMLPFSLKILEMHRALIISMDL